MSAISEVLKNSRKIVVKLGSHVLSTEEGMPDREAIANIVEQIASLKKSGKQIIIVSSGAGICGVGAINKWSRRKDMNYKQALCAIGQVELMMAYKEFFAKYDIHVAQILLTRDDFSNSERELHIRNTLFTLIDEGVVPVINENDSVSVEEIKIGDNDNMSALVASIVDADLVIILSDVDGLYTANPQTHPDARLVSRVEEITPEIEASAGGAGSCVGTGGMFTKIQAAKNATTSGINLIIASGSQKDAISRILEGEEVGTLFVSRENRLQFRKRWLAFGARIMGSVTVDEGCEKAIKKAGGCSILPVGIVAAEGNFEAGNTVSVKNKEGREIARGLCHYSSEELQKIIGCQSAEIESLVGHKAFDEVIHRDDLVILN